MEGPVLGGDGRSHPDAGRAAEQVLQDTMQSEGQGHRAALVSVLRELDEAHLWSAVWGWCVHVCVCVCVCARMCVCA